MSKRKKDNFNTINDKGELVPQQGLFFFSWMVNSTFTYPSSQSSAAMFPLHLWVELLNDFSIGHYATRSTDSLGTGCRFLGALLELSSSSLAGVPLEHPDGYLHPKGTFIYIQVTLWWDLIFLEGDFWRSMVTGTLCAHLRGTQDI